jgi:hypothetical protein
MSEGHRYPHASPPRAPRRPPIEPPGSPLVHRPSHRRPHDDRPRRDGSLRIVTEIAAATFPKTVSRYWRAHLTSVTISNHSIDYLSCPRSCLDTFNKKRRSQSSAVLEQNCSRTIQVPAHLLLSCLCEGATAMNLAWPEQRNAAVRSERSRNAFWGSGPRRSERSGDLAKPDGTHRGRAAPARTDPSDAPSLLSWSLRLGSMLCLSAWVGPHTTFESCRLRARASAPGGARRARARAATRGGAQRAHRSGAERFLNRIREQTGAWRGSSVQPCAAPVSYAQSPAPPQGGGLSFRRCLGAAVGHRAAPAPRPAPALSLPTYPTDARSGKEERLTSRLFRSHPHRHKYRLNTDEGEDIQKIMANESVIRINRLALELSKVLKVAARRGARK